jgi:nucleotide-binding universal stress UspA family protein
VVTVAPPVTSWSGGFSRTYVSEWREPTNDQAVDRRERTRFIGERALAVLEGAGITAELEVREGDAAGELVRAATVSGADLIVVGSRGLSTLPRLVLGSVARKVLLHAPQSVLVVREPRERIRRAEPVEAYERPMAIAGAGAA